ncbi:MAG TPA: NAD(+) synthase [Gammaproteobacteria bacterium]|nr:NAD(+) synthase [Gammaproteobacteria bacterium]
MAENDNFFNLYRHGFMRVAAAIPEVRVADPEFNAGQVAELVDQACRRDAMVVVFPELALSGYTCDDLFHQQTLLEGCETALGTLLEASRDWPAMIAVGLPLAVDNRLFNCAALLHRGRIAGVVPKSYLPGYAEFYEVRQFQPAAAALRDHIRLCGTPDVPFGTDLLFTVPAQPRLVLAMEICEDLWVPAPPSSAATLAGATMVLNLSASNVIIGKADYRRQLVSAQSGRCIAAYVYCGAGTGESTTDLAWDAHAMIYENATPVAESERFAGHRQMIVGDIDLDRLAQDRLRHNTLHEAARSRAGELPRYRRITLEAELPDRGRLLLSRPPARFPYVPSDPAGRDERCQEVYAIQVQGLAQRLRATGLKRMVIGVSGGLDSAHALLVCCRAADLLGLPRSHVMAYTMPGFATGDASLDAARRLMEALGCSAAELDIRPSCMQMLKDIGHPYVDGHPVYDVTFENVQAGERTSHLFRLANHHGALVVGTSDLSELASGWCTYGVGDHMAHYHVNASVPKTLIRHLIRWAADTDQLGTEASPVLRQVLEAVISPELRPADENGGIQRSEDIVGPYPLQDFNLYYLLRFGYTPPKVAFLAYNAWHDATAGEWPPVSEEDRVGYGIGEIRRWLSVFLDRFFRASQFKRSCIANAPKVGSGGSLSPRGDWRAPSDSESRVWLDALAAVPEREPED